MSLLLAKSPVKIQRHRWVQDRSCEDGRVHQEMRPPAQEVSPHQTSMALLLTQSQANRRTGKAMRADQQQHTARRPGKPRTSEIVIERTQSRGTCRGCSAP